MSEGFFNRFTKRKIGDQNSDSPARPAPDARRPENKDPSVNKNELVSQGLNLKFTQENMAGILARQELTEADKPVLSDLLTRNDTPKKLLDAMTDPDTLAIVTPPMANALYRWINEKVIATGTKGVNRDDKEYYTLKPLLYIAGAILARVIQPAEIEQMDPQDPSATRERLTYRLRGLLSSTRDPNLQGNLNNNEKGVFEKSYRRMARKTGFWFATHRFLNTNTVFGDNIPANLRGKKLFTLNNLSNSDWEVKQVQNVLKYLSDEINASYQETPHKTSEKVDHSINFYTLVGIRLACSAKLVLSMADDEYRNGSGMWSVIGRVERYSTEPLPQEIKAIVDKANERIDELRKKAVIKQNER